jgi:hypothetical protein
LNDAHAALLGIVIEITGRAGRRVRSVRRHLSFAVVLREHSGLLDVLNDPGGTGKGVGVRHAIAVIM